MPLIIDCDPGCDDAVAIAVALASPEAFDVLGISTSAGNVPSRLTQKNALMICEFVGRPDVPVYAGCDRPLMRRPVHADVHGASGIDGFPSFEPRGLLQPKHGVDFLIETLLAAKEGSVTLACLAPLTNIAVALIREPRVARGIGQIVLMGGARSAGGNITPAATFNIYFDPHAAHVVFTSGLPITAVSLDATSEVMSSRARLASLAASGRPVACGFAKMISHFDNARIRKFGFTTDGAPINDPCVIAYLIDPAMFHSKHANIEIELQSELTLGMTVVDFWGVTGKKPNATWVYGADGERVFAVLSDRIARL